MPSILFHNGFGHYNPGLVNVSECHGCCSGLVQEAEFAPGQPTLVFTSHYVLLLLELKGGYWLTSDNLGGYQSILFDNPNLTPKTMSFVNLVSLLPTPLGGPCVQVHALLFADC